MKHTIETRDRKGNVLYINIRLSDPHNNGHQDFSITGEAYPKYGRRVKINGSDNCIYCGCCHEEILKARPDLKIFVDLHLSDHSGAPLYAIENGLYHMKNKEVAMDYLRITEEEYNELSQFTQSSGIFAVKLVKMGVPDRWQVEANKAIELLEKMTGEKFVNTSTRSNFNKAELDKLA